MNLVSGDLPSELAVGNLYSYGLGGSTRSRVFEGTCRGSRPSLRVLEVLEPQGTVSAVIWARTQELKREKKRIGQGGKLPPVTGLNAEETLGWEKDLKILPVISDRRVGNQAERRVGPEGKPIFVVFRPIFHPDCSGNRVAWARSGAAALVDGHQGGRFEMDGMNSSVLCLEDLEYRRLFRRGLARVRRLASQRYAAERNKRHGDDVEIEPEYLALFHGLSKMLTVFRSRLSRRSSLALAFLLAAFL
jgi:hypothetical protein